MTEYWVSKQQYYCKYCEIYIRDDKPSRKQHEEGLRHKGNLERYIRNIYKKGERQERDAANEAREIARINAAAAAAHAKDVPPPPTPAQPDDAAAPSTSKAPVKWRGGQNLSNYSDARSLGLVDEEYEQRQQAEAAEQGTSEGRIGQWQAVRRIIRPTTGVQAAGDSMSPPPRAVAAGIDEDAAPPHRIFKERTIADDNDAPWQKLDVKVIKKRKTADIKKEAEEAAQTAALLPGSFKPIKLYAEEEDSGAGPAPEEHDMGCGEAAPNDMMVPPSGDTKPDAATLVSVAEDAKPTVAEGGTEQPKFKKRRGQRGTARSTALI